MSDGWYGPALEDFAANSAGSHTGPVTIGVLHTTESPVGRFKPNSPKDYGHFGHRSYPHFTVDVVGGTCVVWQHISIREAAKALKNRAGGVETNREGCIQIEVVGSATSPITDRAVLVEGLNRLMRWIESQTDIPPACGVTFKSYPASYGTGNGVRLSGRAWQGYAGWLGHQHVPENDHGDPGAIDVKKLIPARPKAAAAAATAKTGVKVAVAKAQGKDPILRKGDHGQSVLNVQNALVRAGYALKPDGWFGDATEKALIAFQRSRGLNTPAVVGPGTWAALRTIPNP